MTPKSWASKVGRHTPGEPVFERWENQEPGFESVTAGSALASRDTFDSGIYRVTFLGEKGSRQSTGLKRAKVDLITFHSNLELVLTLRGLSRVFEDLTLLLDVERKEPEDRDHDGQLERLSSGGRSKILIEYAEDFRRIYAAGCDSLRDGGELKMTFWSKKIRIEKDNHVLINRFSEAEVVMRWSEASRLVRTIERAMQGTMATMPGVGSGLAMPDLGAI